MDIVVGQDNEFLENVGSADEAIYDSERPYGPYTCTVCGKEYDSSFRLREKADYQDFVIISREQAQEQIEKAEKVIEIVGIYLEQRWQTE